MEIKILHRVVVAVIDLEPGMVIIRNGSYYMCTSEHDFRDNTTKMVRLVDGQIEWFCDNTCVELVKNGKFVIDTNE